MLAEPTDRTVPDETASGPPRDRSPISGEKPLPATVTFAFPDFYGEVVPGFEPAGDARERQAELRRVLDPAAAIETIHWGRNYLYRARLETAAGPIDVVVKQFRNQGLKARWLRRLRGSKAARSFRMARAFQAAGVPTPEAVMLVESRLPDGPSFFVSRHLDGVLEARYLFRAALRSREREAFPAVDFDGFLRALARFLRHMHRQGLFHRDLSIGNVLLKKEAGTDPSRRDLYCVDLNRARRVPRLGLGQRIRDLCRLPLARPEHRELFLTTYWGGKAGWSRSVLYRLYHRGFYFRIESKKRIRKLTARFRDWVRPRHAHAHIPPAEAGASARDKIVWDALSDQPHQHASRLEKLAVRIRDTPDHLRQTAAFLRAAPRVWRRYRHLRQELYRREVPWRGVGVCVSPHPRAPEAPVAALDDLGVEHVLLRLRPWEDDPADDVELARELHRRGYELAFALPQNRDLVRDPVRWRSKIEELAERFTPYGRHFQIGQAINRSKWGIWRIREYLDLASTAAEILRRYPGVEIFGPAVIDFELHVTAAMLNLPEVDFRFDGVASLLYVDRRGAPERKQLGFDTAAKVLLLQAIAETSKNSGPRSWITEVNWPLWEGPHSPAGRSVSVDEATQADYLARYYLLALSTGAVERVYWWQLVARGYGLIAPDDASAPDQLRRRPAFRALATLVRELRGRRFVRPLVSPPGARLFLFRGADGSELVAGWSADRRCRARLPRPATAVVESDGGTSVAADVEVELAPSVRYFHLHLQLCT